MAKKKQDTPLRTRPEKSKVVPVKKNGKIVDYKEVDSVYPTTGEDVSTAVVLSSLEEKAKHPFSKLKRITVVNSSADVEKVAEQIKLLKDLKEEAEKEATSLKSPSKLAAKLTAKRVDAHFQPFMDKVDNTEIEYKLLISAFLTKNKKAIVALDKKMESGKIAKVSTYTNKANELRVTGGKFAQIRTLKKLQINNADKIPRQYLVPDNKAIEQALRAGSEVPGCELVENDNIAI